MRLGKDLVGKPIYSMTDGKYLGKVKDLYLDKKLFALAGLFLGKEGIISRKSILIPREQVPVFGIDAILVKHSEVVTDSETYTASASWVLRGDVEGRPIDTSGGTKVGTVGDIVINEEAKIIGYTLARVYVEGPIAEKRMVMNDAILDNGTDDGAMTIDISKAEQSFSE